VENFEKSFKPKALSTKHLDEVSRSICPHLEYFVVFSSVSCGRGNGGQTNYGLSNSVTERIIEQRRAENLPAKVIQWGPIADVGMLENVEAAAFYGFTLQSITSCCDVLDKVLMRDEAVFSSLVCASKKKDSSKQTDLFSTLINALGIGEVNAIDQNQPLASLGLDSISGTEIQQVFERELGISITLKEIRSKSLKEIQEIVQTSDGKSKKPKDIARPPPSLNMNDIPYMPFE
jgi:fatty acid synthase, animal type